MKKIITSMLLSSIFLTACSEGKLQISTVISDAVELSRAQSIALGLDPDLEDTDGDGISDNAEIGTDAANPLDTDNDGIIDALESGSTASDGGQSIITLNVSAATASTLILPQLSGLALKFAVDGGTVNPVGLLTSETSLSGVATDTQDADYDFPYGLIDFNATENDSVNNTSLTVNYPNSLNVPADAVLRIRKPDGSWISLPQSQQVGVLQLTGAAFMDGGVYDLDPEPNKVRYLAGLGEAIEPAQAPEIPTPTPTTASVVSITTQLAEGSGGFTNALFKVSLDAVADEAVIITYQTVNGTAQSPADYTAVSNGTVIIQPGQLTVQIAIMVITDETDEGNETFSLELLTISSDGTLSASNNKAEVMIIDDDEMLDQDADTVVDSSDNCPTVANTNQLDTDADGQGDACDADDDNDGLSDTDEASKGSDPLNVDTDNDGESDLTDELPLDSSKVLTLKSAHRLLLQTTYGPLSADLDEVQQSGAEQWVDKQLNLPAAHDDETDDHLTHTQRLIEIAQLAKPNQNWYTVGGEGLSPFNRALGDQATDEYQMAVWWENAIGLHPTKTKHGRDQLRQRVAFALSQLLVVSTGEGQLHRRGEGLVSYYDMLVRHSFGNYRDLLGEMARHPVMGIYLSHQGNKKANVTTGTIPDENFARELMQLFTIGLYELNMDGSPDSDNNQLTFPDAGAAVVPSYTQDDVQELAKVMTGWDLADNRVYGLAHQKTGNYLLPMEFTPDQHEDEVAEGGDGQITLLGETLDLSSGADGSGMDAVLDVLFYHPNIAPFVSKHLIMRLVTSNPSSAYVARVAQVFVDNGAGVRGDIKAVVRAILLDDESRNTANIGDNDGKVKEPVIAYTQLLRALGTVPLDGWISNDDELTPVSGVYWHKSPQVTFGQGALRSPSVFNFYTPDYVPSNSYFSERGLVSPEVKIITAQNVLGFSNDVYLAAWFFLKNKIVDIDNKTLEAFAANRKFGHVSNFVTNIDEPLALLKAAISGDVANLEAITASEKPNLTAAANAVLDYYDRLLLGGEMPETYRQALLTYLVNASYTAYGNKDLVAMVMIKDTLHTMITSNLYRVQK